MENEFKGRDFAYARVSTVDQNLDLQYDAFERAGIPRNRVYEDKASGRSLDRAGLQRVMKLMRSGDRLTVWRLDRLGRNAVEVLPLVQDLDEAGIAFRSLQEGIDATTSGGRMMLGMLAVMAQWESDVISERTKAAMATARKRGAKQGRRNYILGSKKRLKRFTEMWLNGDVPEGAAGGQTVIREMNRVDRKAPQYKAPASYTNWRSKKFPGLRAAWEKAAKGNGELADMARQALEMSNCPKETK